MSATPASLSAPPAPSAEAPGAVARAFGVDLRSLALFRILIAGMLLIDLAERARDLSAHYSEAGVLPRAGVDALWPALARWSFHYHASGSEIVLALLFGLAAIFGGMLLLGWRTRLAVVASWVLLTSLHRRNPLLNFGADQVLAMLLFWGMFLPLGARASLDALRLRRDAGGERPQSHHYASLATGALLLQIAFVYWFSLVRRTTPIWWEGDAIHYALQLDLFASQAAVWLREATSLHWAFPFLTWATLAVEAVGPLFALSPWANGWLRLLAVGAFAGLHVGFAVFLDLGLFSPVSIAAWLVFLPALFWEAVTGRGLTPATSLRAADVAAPSRTGTAVAGLAFALVFALNLRQAAVPGLGAVVPDFVLDTGRQLRIHQPWAMFTPHPPIGDGWFVLEAHRPDGEGFDLLTGEPVTFEKPALVTATFPNHRWNVYFYRLSLPGFQQLAAFGVPRLCREWERPLRDLRVVWMSERNVAPGQVLRPARPTVLVETDCQD